MREMADYVRESFVWCWRSALRSLRPLPEGFHALCPRFSLFEAKGMATDFELPKIVQATFYAMLLNVTVELGVAHSFTAEGLKSTLVGSFRPRPQAASLRLPRPMASFAVKVARRYACDSNLSEMMPTIFYTMVIDDAADLGRSRKLTIDVIMGAMQKLDWGLMEAWLEDNDQRLHKA
ncbi:hypothetical protein Cgig2_007132 [Carnegiea gigantea]|uniref:Uncharacterized protein n=1 Tax=Carnegiea gigantea TaxID=171969 RepID=A0A9Q1KMV3_9CARY|nr:hypothetical protein Cgig2_007132 [Carnegiea gigantea]